MKVQFLVLFFGVKLFFFQNQGSVFYIVDKGVFVKLEKHEKERKITFTMEYDFYFSVKNDSIAFIQKIYNGKEGEIEKYNVSPKFDTTYVKHFVIENGKKKINEIEMLVYKKVFKKSR